MSLDFEDIHRGLEHGKEFFDPHHQGSTKVFPFKVTSPFSRRYNCVAHAVRLDDLWIQPKRFPKLYPEAIYHWPEGISEKGDLASYIELFQKIFGFECCDTQDVEPGFEKIALFHQHRFGVHVARQLSDGLWTSKMGPGVDVSHMIEAYMGKTFDYVMQYMRRVGNPSTNPFEHQPYKRAKAVR